MVIYNSTFKYNPNSIALIKDTQYIDVNYAFCAMLGYIKAELLQLDTPCQINNISQYDSNGSLLYIKECFSKAILGNPDATIITRLKDDLILDINEAFTGLTGFSYDDTIVKECSFSPELLEFDGKSVRWVLSGE